ncbi:MAG: hypothetical protein SF069_07450 [Phycisphaerae bacterium]|nr:hypothetical protein [Phycisphaerae bacterium]
MARKIKQIAENLGAKIVGRLPEVGGGAFGAARLPQAVADLKSRLKPSRGARPGRPTNSNWVERPKVPMSAATIRKLKKLASQASSSERKVSPMQVAAELLESAVASCN